jgi:hypothetical protein
VSDDRTFSVPAIAIPGMRVTYQVQIGDGQTIAYEVGVDATIAREDLDELFDRVGGAAARRKAVFDLPLTELSLAGAKAMLVQQRKAHAAAVATQEAHIQRMSENRRNQAQATQVDVMAVAQFDQRIMQLERQIVQDTRMVEYLKAIIAGETPPELFPAANDMAMAAE